MDASPQKNETINDNNIEKVYTERSISQVKEREKKPNKRFISYNHFLNKFIAYAILR